jgi:hypothetical protein
MSGWTDRELQTIDRVDELRISSARADGTALAATVKAPPR